MASMAATVEYQDPNLTIVAKQEPLDVVLKSLGKEMRIYITVPTGLNPVVSCDIQQQPIKQAFKTLLGDMNYSLEWEKNTGKLVGLTILAGGDGAAVANVSAKPSHAQSVEQLPTLACCKYQWTGRSKAYCAEQPCPPMREDDVADHDAAMAEHEARMETERAEHEARMETERVEHEARMVEERAAQEVRMKEEVARHDAELEAELAAEGLQPPQ